MRHRRITGPAALMACLVMATAITPPAGAAAPAPPSLRLLVMEPHVTLPRYGNGPVSLDVGAYIAPVGGTFRIDVTRAGYRAPIEAAQVVGTGSGAQRIPLPEGTVRTWNGLPWFLTITVTDRGGNVVAVRHPTFCPNGYDLQRLSPDGPANPTFPLSCSANPFTLGMVWGIDDGWALNPISTANRIPQVRLPDGRYQVRVDVSPKYAALFGVSDEDASVTVAATVKTETGCDKFCDKTRRDARLQDPRVGGVPVTTSPDLATVPDLVALPAYGINIDHQGNRDFLAFGATVWNRGPAKMVIEGFRRPGNPVMDAWEFFYDPDGNVVGRARVGTLRYHSAPGHEHWHFLQFATYELVDADKSSIVYSTKQGFCLVPTDAIDLVVPGADWNPGRLGFGGSVCGSQNALWTRETLPTGWGDTYYQGIPGQSFDITNLPNGTYFIAVKANPTGKVYERSTSNNVRYRRVILGGTKGARTLRVPPWNGIDTEAGGGGPEPG